ncbi:nuclear GTPase SLIP-GC-like [Fundulus diaphanus]
MWKGIVGNCSAVWIVSEINRAASDRESWEVLKRASSLLGNGGECRHIHFICTKSDVIGDLHDHSAANVQAFILKRNIKAKEAVSKELNKLTEIKNYFSDECFKVFTVSSAEFIKRKHLNPENTEIPELQDFLQNLNDCQTLNYVSGAQGILSLIQGASVREAVEIPGLLERTMMESIELSLQSEDNSIPDVSTELSMVQKLCNELNSYMDP